MQIEGLYDVIFSSHNEEEEPYNHISHLSDKNGEHLWVAVLIDTERYN